MTKRRLSAGVVAVVASILAAVLLIGWFTWTEYKSSTFNIVFYNDTAPQDKPNQNSGDVLDEAFISEILAAMPPEVRANPEKYPELFKEDLFDRVYNQEENSGDPALLAQLALDAMLRAPKTVSERLLPYTEQSTEMWRETVLRFIDNSGDHISTAGRLQAIWNQATSVQVRQITNGYVSSGYMKRDGIVLDQEHAERLGRNAVPQPILENNNGVNGWEIVFSFKNGEILSYRINCGYQPDTSKYPSGGSTPTYKPPNISIDIKDPNKPNISVDIDDRPKPKPPGGGGGGGGGGGSTPTPAPKVPDAGPQGQNPSNPDYGGGSNSNNDERLKPEPSSPPTYNPPPKPPPPAADDDRFDQPADNGGGLTGSDGDRGTTGTIGVDNNGDGHNDGSLTGEVDIGPAPPSSLDDVHENPPSVEPGLNDGQNTGDPPPPH